MNHPFSTPNAHNPAHTDSNPLRLGHRLAHHAAGFLLLLTALILNLSSPLHAQEVMGPDAKVRVGFEKRTLTAEQAKMILNGTVPGGEDENNRWGNHYIDLWTYVYYDVEHFSKFVKTT
ncbi:MAG: hypothetical protein K2H68_07240, partial [Bacteroidales bacterium]|nr:hypothetical protein [Bacteroidales bacterium]